MGGTCTYDYLFCKDNYECEYYQTCNQGINMCQTSDGYCLSDSDCYDGKFCDVYHQCLERYDSSKPDEYSCKKDSDCQTGNICYKNVCIEDDPMDIWELLFGWLF